MGEGLSSQYNMLATHWINPSKEQGTKPGSTTGRAGQGRAGQEGPSALRRIGEGLSSQYDMVVTQWINQPKQRGCWAGDPSRKHHRQGRAEQGSTGQRLSKQAKEDGHISSCYDLPISIASQLSRLLPAHGLTPLTHLSIAELTKAGPPALA